MSTIMYTDMFQDWFLHCYTELANEERAAEYADRMLQNSTMLIKFIDNYYISVDYWYNEGSIHYPIEHLPNFPSLNMNIVLDESDGYDKECFVTSTLTLIPNTYTPGDVKNFIQAQCFHLQGFNIDDFLTRRTLVLNIQNGIRHYDFENILFKRRPSEDYFEILRNLGDIEYRNKFVNRHCEEVKSLFNEALNECGES